MDWSNDGGFEIVVLNLLIDRHSIRDALVSHASAFHSLRHSSDDTGAYNELFKNYDEKKWTKANNGTGTSDHRLKYRL